MVKFDDFGKTRANFQDESETIKCNSKIDWTKPLHTCFSFCLSATPPSVRFSEHQLHLALTQPGSPFESLLDDSAAICLFFRPIYLVANVVQSISFHPAVCLISKPLSFWYVCYVTHQWDCGRFSRITSRTRFGTSPNRCLLFLDLDKIPAPQVNRTRLEVSFPERRSFRHEPQMLWNHSAAVFAARFDASLVACSAGRAALMKLVDAAKCLWSRVEPPAFSGKSSKALACNLFRLFEGQWFDAPRGVDSLVGLIFCI